MRLWKDVEPGVRSLIQDEVEGSAEEAAYSQADLLRWWEWAQDELATFKPLPQRKVYQVSDGSVVALPGDHYRTTGVLWEGHEFLEQVSVEEGVKFYSASVSVGSYPKKYYVEGDRLHLLREPQQPWTLLYAAYYPPPTGNDSPILLPRWGVQACTYHAASSAAVQAAFGTAELRQYATRQDAGTPEHNPLAKIAQLLMDRFYGIVYKHASGEEA
jgi:hypothetical protein